MHKQIIIFLGSNYKSDLVRIEQLLPYYLSTKYKVFCFEFPQFRKIFRIISGFVPLVEKISPNLTVFHSIGFFPWVRNFAILNRINHLINFKLFKVLTGKKINKSTIISFTPETYYLSTEQIQPKQIIYYVYDNYASLPFWKNPGASLQLKKPDKKFIKLKFKKVNL